MPAPIAADLGPCADGSAVRTALAAWPRRCALAGLGAVHLGQVGDTDGRTDRSRHWLMLPYGGGIIISNA